MPTIAYLANLFPATTESYIGDEIRELRKRGILVVPCSIRQSAHASDQTLDSWVPQTIYLQPVHVTVLLQAAWLCLREFTCLKKLLWRVLLPGNPSLSKRVRTLAHTFFGAYYAVVLRKFSVCHIHVHHGYFGSWVAMVAARLLGIEFSMTLHGSDLLVHPAYLDLKLELCQFCVTISEFNRRHILDHYPEVDPRKIVVQRLGVDCGENTPPTLQEKHDPFSLGMLTAGRLHPVKNHAFLVRACRLLKDRGLNFHCLIAGDGCERPALQQLIDAFELQSEVRLIGQIPREDMCDYYDSADLVVITSRSEGIPLVLMEAMARGKLVLAPAITGIPELVSDGETGFLYCPGALQDFVARVETINRSRSSLGRVRRAARKHVIEHYNRQANLAAFCDLLVASLALKPNSATSNLHDQRILYENPVLQ